jgi:RsiW-degrading membrane proteinase PrsW (M82 family)
MVKDREKWDLMVMVTSALGGAKIFAGVFLFITMPDTSACPSVSANLYLYPCLCIFLGVMWIGRGQKIKQLPAMVPPASQPAKTAGATATFSASCCSSVGLFLLAYVVVMTAAAVAAAKATTPVSSVVSLLALAVAPPLAILVFLARTFGESVDRRQVGLTFFTAVLWMMPLLAFIYHVLAPSGALRAVYSLDSTCAECFDSVTECGARAHADCCLPDPHDSSRAFQWNMTAADGGRCQVPLESDAEPSSLCTCHWRNVVMAFFRAGFLEETLKYLSVCFIYRKDYVADPSALVLYAITAACGFALAENLEYVLSSASASSEQAITTAIVRAVLSIPLHAGTGAIIGSLLARRRFVGRKVPSEHLGFCRIIVPPVLFHGCYDWFMFAQPLGTAGSPSAALLNNILVPALLVLGTWLTARHEYTKVDSHPQVGPIPRVNVRLLEAEGTIPHAKLSDCLCRNFLCELLLGRRQPEQRMRLTTIQEASREATAKQQQEQQLGASLLPLSMAATQMMSHEVGDVIESSGGMRKRSLVSHFYIMIILSRIPRQARDTQ